MMPDFAGTLFHSSGVATWEAQVPIDFFILGSYSFKWN